MLEVISLGAGVQSTTMALMAAHGEIEPIPDYAVLADTGAAHPVEEPRPFASGLDRGASAGLSQANRCMSPGNEAV